jgi:hypothetical protein
MARSIGGGDSPSVSRMTDIAIDDITISSPLAGAKALLDSGLCIWCEAAPATHASHLCGDCAAQDPDGVLGKPSPARVDSAA